jgi:hypothetical protein
MVPGKPRILMLAPECFPAYGAEAIVNAKLALAALDAGWKIDVVSRHIEYSEYHEYPNYDGRSVMIYIIETCKMGCYKRRMLCLN